MLFKNNYNLTGGAIFDLTDSSSIERCVCSNLSVLYDTIERVINSADDINEDLRQRYLNYLETIKKTQVPYTIKNLNLKSLQCVILITLLIMAQYKYSDEVLMKTYPRMWGGLYNIIDLFKRFLSHDWLNLQKLEEICIYDITLRKLIKNYPYESFDKSEPLPKPVDYTENIENARICILVSVLSFEERLDYQFKLVNIIGITTQMEYVNDKYYTPFEFLHYNLVNANNIEGSATDKVMLKYGLFYEYLKGKKSDLDDIYHDFIIMLFLVVHRYYNTRLLTGDKIPTIDSITRSPNDKQFITNVDNWMNPYFLGRFLPPKIKDIAKTDKKRRTIIPYLNDTLKYLYLEYQEFIFITTPEDHGNYNQYDEYDEFITTHYNDRSYKKYLKYKNKYLSLRKNIQ